MQALNPVHFGTPEKERPLIMGYPNMPSVHADMLRHALNNNAAPDVVHSGLARMCETLTEFRESIEATPKEVSRLTG